MVRLGDVCTFYSGTGFPNIYQGKADGKYPFYKVGDISRNVLSGNRELKICENYIDDDTATKIKGTLLPPQTVVFAKIGEALRLNRRAITSRDCLVDNNAMGIKSDDSIIDSLYFYYFMCNVDLQNYCESTTVPSVRKTRIAEIEIPLPPLDEQRRIAAVLDKVSDLIAKRREQLDKLDELVKARFVEMFGDVIQNERSWKQYIFSDIATSRLGKMLDAKQQTGKYEYPYLANFNVQWFRFELDNLNKMDFNEADQQEFELREGDLLVCEGGEIGRCAVWHNEIHPCYFQKALHRVRCNQRIIMPDYMAWWFKYNCDHNGFAAIEGAKATIAHLPGVKLKALKVTVPEIKLQEKFVTFLKQTDKSKLTIQQSLDKLEVLKKALMQQYFG